MTEEKDDSTPPATRTTIDDLKPTLDIPKADAEDVAGGRAMVDPYPRTATGRCDNSSTDID